MAGEDPRSRAGHDAGTPHREDEVGMRTVLFSTIDEMFVALGVKKHHLSPRPNISNAE